MFLRNSRGLVRLHYVRVLYTGVCTFSTEADVWRTLYSRILQQHTPGIAVLVARSSDGS